MSPEEDVFDSVIQDDLSAFLRKVNPMALGTAGLGGVYRDIGDNAAKSNIAVDTVSAALAGGMNLFDTAPWYANSEYVLGDALAKASPQRSDYFIATKVGRYPTSDLEKPHGDFDYSPARICESVASSLEKLQTNYLDIVYLHDVEFVHHEPGVIRKALLALRELQKVKKVKLIGICGYPLEVLDQIVDTCGELIQIVQSHCRLTLQNDSLLEKAAKWSEKGIAVSNAAVLASK
ncbi:hypothetical protein HDU84_009534 [Entophlyctis sp. JEL0112]|nr:hypothetical protein HDU84_009534 [Entophlyctis sp. JEL0112]